MIRAMEVAHSFLIRDLIGFRTNTIKEREMHRAISSITLILMQQVWVRTTIIKLTITRIIKNNSSIATMEVVSLAKMLHTMDTSIITINSMVTTEEKRSLKSNAGNRLSITWKMRETMIFWQRSCSMTSCSIRRSKNCLHLNQGTHLLVLRMPKKISSPLMKTNSRD